MQDHASQLRRLALRAGRQTSVGDEPAPHLVVVSGGQAGVGTTTIAVNLAVSLAAQGLRTVLLDADLNHAGAASACGCPSSPNLADVLAGRHDIHEVLQLGAGGIQLIAGSSALEAREACNTRALQRLLRQVKGLGRYADAVVVDAGGATTDLSRRFWEMANEVLLVTSPNAATVMDTYAKLKTLWSAETSQAVPELLVNRADTAELAADVHRRIDQSCQRFLDLTVPLAGNVANDVGLPGASASGVPLVLSQVDSQLANWTDARAAALSDREGRAATQRAA